jgi:uncharacterized spore protein YtfJ
MNGDLGKTVVTAVQNQEQAGELLNKLIAVAQPGSVFSQPVTAGDYTIINASEVSAAVGVGFGVGAGTGSGPSTGQASAGAQSGEGGGGGGGGGGGAMARPVATISIGPDGVTVEPVVDVTKIAIAFFTTLGTMALMFRRVRRGR